MKLTKMITRSSIALLALCSTSAFAGVAFLGPDYTVHKAKVNLKVTYSINPFDKIEKENVKTNEMIDILTTGPVNDDAELAMAVPCDDGDILVVDPDVVALFVANKNTGLPVINTDWMILNATSLAVEIKDGDPKKIDAVFALLNPPFLFGDGEFNFDRLTASGTTKFGKIGNNVADMAVGWDKDTVCAKEFNGKSTTGTIASLVDPIADLNLMSGKISAGKAKAAFDCDGILDFGGLCVVP